jgi:hypothetical protein
VKKSLRDKQIKLVTKAIAERKERQYESKGSKGQIELGQSDRNKRGNKEWSTNKSIWYEG